MRSRRVGRCVSFVIMLLMIVSPLGLLPLNAAAEGGETVEVDFDQGVNAAQTQYTYNGQTTLTITGTGQASGTAYSDAFYIYTDGSGNLITPVHPSGFVLMIDGQPADQLVSPIPAYSPDHRYVVTVDAPGGHLTFGVGDAFTSDNTGAYFLTITIGVSAQSSILYYALGDSIASGHGLNDDSDGYAGGCHRSLKNSYPALVAQGLKESHEVIFTKDTFLACSGASYHPDVTSCQQKAPPDYNRSLCQDLNFTRQINDLKADLNRNADQPALVSITFGIDNLPWTDVSKVEKWMTESDSDYLTAIHGYIDPAMKHLAKQLESVLSTYPNAKIVLTGVYDPFNPDSKVFTSARDIAAASGLARQLSRSPLFAVSNPRLSELLAVGLRTQWAQTNVPKKPLCTYVYGCYQKTMAGINILDQELQGVVQTEQAKHPGYIEFAPVFDEFLSHASPAPQCGATNVGDTWIQYPGEVQRAGEPKINSPMPIIEKALIFQSFQPFGDCFHPNSSGAKAYAQSVLAAMQTLGN